MPKAVLAGGRGFLGQLLAQHLAVCGWQVVVLTREPRHPGETGWDGRTLGPWTRELDGADALVNLTGRSVNCLHDEENRRQILASRLDSVRVLGEAVAGCVRPPRVWIQCASLALYGDAGDRVCDENAPLAADFSAQVCRQWEEAFHAAPTLVTRKVLFRIGLVFGPGGGAFGPLAKLVRRFLGGTVGSGRQYVSWLHAADMNAMFLAAIERADFSGAYNACTPQPVTNAELMRELRTALRRPWSPPAPEWAVRFGARHFLRTDADLVLTGRRCVPARLEARGFQFRFPRIREALADLVAHGA